MCRGFAILAGKTERRLARGPGKVAKLTRMTGKALRRRQGPLEHQRAEIVDLRQFEAGLNTGSEGMKTVNGQKLMVNRLEGRILPLTNDH